jgi:transposase
MPVYAVSNDTKAHIPALFQDGYTVREICHLLGVKKSLVYNTLDLYNRYGIVYNPHKYSVTGRRRVLSTTDVLFI